MITQTAQDGQVSPTNFHRSDPEVSPHMPNADQLLARLYALRKDYADDPEDETYQALHHAFLFISYNMAAFKEYVRQEAEKEEE
jgi:hypothetical protein